MSRRRRPVLLAALAAFLCGMTTSAAQAKTEIEVMAPQDPLRFSVGLSYGRHFIENESYQDFFGVDELNTWTLRADYRVWRFLRAGAAMTASDKSRERREITFSSDAYPVLYNFSAFQGSGELYLRSQLPAVSFVRPYVSIGAVLSRIRAESSGYTDGYDAAWEEYRPAPDIIKYSSGWRGALGIQFPIWANVFFSVEGSRLELERYDGPEDLDPAVGLWDHSGWRLDAGLLQRF